MSSELNDLRSNLQAASVGCEPAVECKNSNAESTYNSSEAAVQAILESLKDSEFYRAIHHIRECRYNFGSEKEIRKIHYNNNK